MDFIFTEYMGPMVCVENPLCPYEINFFVNPMYDKLDEIGSFEAFCIGHYGGMWIRDLCDSILNDEVPVGKITPTVPYPTSAVVECAEIVRVEFTRIDREHFYADAILSASINISMNRGRKNDKVTQWYRIRNKFTAAENIIGYESYQAVIYDKSDSASGQKLDKYLIPIMDEDSFDDEAERILTEFYPDALNENKPVDGYKLAEKMGLKVFELPLVDKNLFGRAIFKDCTAEIEKDEAALEKLGLKIRQKEAAAKAPAYRVPIKKNTILINSSCHLTELERNESVIHECVHFATHDLFMWAQEQYNDEISGIDCPVIEGSYPSEGKSPVFWAEWQARMLTYRIKLNRTAVEKKAKEAQAEYSRKYWNTDRGPKLEYTIRTLAKRFNFSKSCVKKRLLELGHSEFAGVFDYVNGGYVLPYFFKEGTLGKNQSYTIGFKEALEEFRRNEEFRKLLSSGRYIYAEGKFCLNMPKYIIVKSGKGANLTIYARNHVDECCIKFESVYANKKMRYVYGQLNRELTKSEIEHRKLIKPLFAARPGECTGAEMMKFCKWTTETSKEIAPLDFGDALKHLMKKRDVRVEEMEERTMISERTISRLRNDENCIVRREQIVAIAIGLNLPPKLSLMLMDKAGLTLRNNDKDNFYEFIIETMYGATIYDVNAFLADAEIDLSAELAKTGA